MLDLTKLQQADPEVSLGKLFRAYGLFEFIIGKIMSQIAEICPVTNVPLNVSMLNIPWVDFHCVLHSVRRVERMINLDPPQVTSPGSYTNSLHTTVSCKGKF